MNIRQNMIASGGLSRLAIALPARRNSQAMRDLTLTLEQMENSVATLQTSVTRFRL